MIAARKSSDDGEDGPRLDAKLFHRALAGRRLGVDMRDEWSRQSLQRGEREIRHDRLIEQQSKSFAIFGDEADARSDRIGWFVDRDPRTAHEELARRSAGMRAEDRHHQIAAAGAD